MNWIDIKDRLPEVNPKYDLSEEVLVTVENRDTEFSSFRQLPFKYVHTAVINHNGVWLHSWDHSIIELSRDDKVVGWMPIPEPMKDATN